MAGEKNISYQSDSFRGAVVITPSDTVNITDPCSAVFVGVAGNITAVMSTGEVVLFTNVPVGVFPICVTRINATGTGASGLVGLK